MSWPEDRPSISLTKDVVVKLNDIVSGGMVDLITVSVVGDHGLLTVRTHYKNNPATQETYVLNKHGKEVKV